jgi:tRNA pseudouridine38-40 synthase
MDAPEERRYRATLAYDGSAYQGFQRQVDGRPSIQQAVEMAIAAVTGQEIAIMGAGRTDSGVHARGQVIAFDAVWRHGDGDLLRAINVNLPVDIALQDLTQQPDFHPRFDAVSRVYQYTIVQAEQRQPLLQKYAWQIRYPLDVTAMQAAANLLVGEYDFAAFGRPPKGTDTVRTVLVSRWTQQNESFGLLLTYRIEANAFLYRMVRRIVGMLVDVGRKALTVAQFAAVFQSAKSTGAVTLAPPQGLVLEAVRYPEIVSIP